MKINDLYELAPAERRREIVRDTAGHVFYDGKEYIPDADGELVLIRNDRATQQKLDGIVTKTGAVLKG